MAVCVVNADSWKNIAGVNVGGEQDGDALRVCRDLSSLFHELAHLCQSRIDNAPDESHATWAARGIFGADEQYRRRLKE
jgi:hypothetical protein